jgi:hypothetical protein
MDEAENVCCATSASKSEALHTNPTHARSGSQAMGHPDCEEKRDPRE